MKISGDTDEPMSNKTAKFQQKYLFVIKRLTKNCDRDYFKSQHAWRHIDITPWAIKNEPNLYAPNSHLSTDFDYIWPDYLSALRNYSLQILLESSLQQQRYNVLNQCTVFDTSPLWRILMTLRLYELLHSSTSRLHTQGVRQKNQFFRRYVAVRKDVSSLIFFIVATCQKQCPSLKRCIFATTKTILAKFAVNNSVKWINNLAKCS